MKVVAVFFGGQSTEREVSVLTGTLTLNSIDVERYVPLPVYVDKDGRWYSGKDLFNVDNYKNLNYKNLTQVTVKSGSNKLYKIKKNKLKEFSEIYAVINCMHGERGEDGSLSGVMKMFDFPFVSPDVLSSAVCMDKDFTKIFLRGIKVNSLPSVSVSGKNNISDVKLPFDYPVIVKPSLGGSSIGIKCVEKKEDLQPSILYALKYGERAIIEPKLNDFTEINCAVCRIKGKITASKLEQPVSAKEILSFKDKYESGRRIFPAILEKSTENKIRETARMIYAKLNIYGTIRIDFFISYDGEIFVNEINTVPGSLAYYLFSDTLKGFTKLLTSQIEEGVEKYNSKKGEERSFNSGILSSLSGSKGLKHL